jgi:FolB domain-containing protein
MDVLDLMIDASKHKWQSFPSADTDFVFVRNVQIQANIGPDAWGRDKMQPVIVSARLPFSVEKAGESDDIAHTLDYRTVYKAIRKFDAVESASAQKWDHLEQLGEKIAEDIGFTKGARIDLEAPKALLHSGGIILRLDDFPVSHERLINISHLASHRLAVKAMHIPCIIGIGEHERLQKQPVVVDFAVDADVSSKIKPFHVIYKELYEVHNHLTFTICATKYSYRCSRNLHF